MPKSNTPYDPQPERQDALGEMAGKGYQAVPGDHASRLKAIQEKLSLPADGIVPPKAVVRSMRPRRWLAFAAGIAALLVAGIVLFTYNGGEEQLAMAVEQTQVQPVEEDIENSNQRKARKKDEVAADVISIEEPAFEKALAVPQQEEMERPVADGGATDASTASQSGFKPTSTVSRVSPPADVEEIQGATTSSAPVNQVVDMAEVSPNPPVASAVAAATQKAKRKKVEERSAPIAEMLADEEAEVETKIDVEDETPSQFQMERAASAIATREVTGEVLEPSGLPVIGAVLLIEETGQRVVTDEKGEFTILVTSEAVVGDVSAPGHNPLLFDITVGDEYRLILPRISSSIPSAELKGKAVSLRIIAPNAPRYEGFDTYVRQQKLALEGDMVTVQFEVNRFGRPRQIVSGPGFQDRNAVKVAKDLLKNGPDWPEVYRRKSWRYTMKYK